MLGRSASIGEILTCTLKLRLRQEGKRRARCSHVVGALGEVCHLLCTEYSVESVPVSRMQTLSCECGMARVRSFARVTALDLVVTVCQIRDKEFKSTDSKSEKKIEENMIAVDRI